jgi:hypothetical protein
MAAGAEKSMLATWTKMAAPASQDRAGRLIDVVMEALTV